MITILSIYLFSNNLSLSRSLSAGGPVGSVSVDSRAAGVGGNAAENHSDHSSELKATFIYTLHNVITMATPTMRSAAVTMTSLDLGRNSSFIYPTVF